MSKKVELQVILKLQIIQHKRVILVKAIRFTLNKIFEGGTGTKKGISIRKREVNPNPGSSPLEMLVQTLMVITELGGKEKNVSCF